MAEQIEFRANFDDSDVQAALQRMIAAVDRGQVEFDQLGTDGAQAMAQVANAAKATEKQVLSTAAATAAANNDFKAALIEQRIAINQQRKELAQLESQYNSLGRTGQKSATDLKARINELRASVKQSALGMGELRIAQQLYNKAQEESRKGGDRWRGQIKLTSSEAQNLSFQLQDLIVQVGSGQGIFRPLLQQGPQIVQIFGSVGNTFRFFGQQALKAFKSVLTLRGGLLLLSTATVALIALPIILFLTRSAKATEFLQRKFAGLAAGVRVITDRLAKFGGVLVDLVRGQASLNDVFNAGAEATRGLGKAFSDARKEGEELQGQLQQLRGAQTAFSLQNIELERQAQVARAKAGNDAIGLRQRVALIRQAGKAEAEVRATNISLARQELDIAERQRKGAKEIADLRENLNKLVAENSVAEVQAQNEVNALLRQGAEEVRRLREEYAKLLQDLGKRVQEAQLDQLFDFDRIERERDLALAEVERFRQEIVAAATKAGQALPPSFQANIEELIKAVQAEFRRAADKLANRTEQDRGLLIETLMPGFNRIDSDLKQAGKEAAQEMGAALREELRKQQLRNRPIIENIRNDIAVAFGLNDAQLSYIEQQAGLAATALTDVLQSSTQAQIEQQDVLLQAITRRIEETQRLLDQELRRQEQGYANNVDTLKRRLEEENKARAEAEKKRLDLERKAANQRLIINSAEQVSNYILAITKLTAAEAGKGLIGLFTAVAGVALLASIIARARANAKQFQEVPQFRTGTEFVDGPGNKYSDSVPARLSRGERVVPADLNAEIGGRSVTNEELARLFTVGRLVEDRFPHLDLSALRMPSTPLSPSVDMSAILREIYRGQREMAELSARNDRQAMKEAYREAADAAAERMIEYWKTRPTEWIDSDGAKVYERQEGGKIERKRIKTDRI